MTSSSPKKLLFAELAGLARTLGNENRLELIELLAQSPQPVEVLAERSGLSLANVSQHLQGMRKAGLVVGQRDGKNVRYQLREGPIVEALAALRSLAEHNVAAVADIRRRYLDKMDGLAPVESDELLALLKSDSVLLLDVRPEDEFRSGHLPGARHIALDELEGRIAELSGKPQIVAYCRGPYCVLSWRATELLREHGLSVRRLRAGFPEWKAAGLPVETN